MNRKELAKDIAKCAPKAFNIIEGEATSVVVDIIVKQTLAAIVVKQTLGRIIEAAVEETCTRIAREHLLTEPSRN